MKSLDWSLVQAFLAVAEAGSLSAAARALGLSQPTVGRQVKAAEAALGLVLFRRHAKGLAPTEAGAALLEPARAMRAAMGEIALYAAGQDAAPTGTVRITASEVVAHYLLPPIIARLRREAPEIAIELAPSDSVENLLFREADIAVRMYEPEQHDLVKSYLGAVELAAFASRAYAARCGVPATAGDLLTHDLVGYDRSELIVRGMRAAGLDVDRAEFPVRCDSQTAYWELVRAGCGIGFGLARVGRADPDLIEVPLDAPLPTLPMWLAAHREVRHTRRVRRVWEALATDLRP